MKYLYLSLNLKNLIKKDKDLPIDNNPHTLEELTERANKIIESLENEKNLDNSVEKYQELLKLNKVIERKFHKDFRNISEEANNKVKKIINQKEKESYYCIQEKLIS